MISVGSIKKARQYESIVLSILRERPDAQDDDYALFYYVLEKRGLNIKELNAYELLLRMSKKEIPSVLSISRARRKVQEEYPEVRGTKWEKRQRKAKDVRREIQK